jgi:hypothetical protein
MPTGFWDADQQIVLQHGEFQKEAIKDIYGIFVQDPSIEAAIWQDSGAPYKGDNKN